MDLFAVIGHPIAHSLSPLLHNTAFRLLSLDCRYEAFDVEPSALVSAIADFKLKGFVGLNVTLPHKEKVFEITDEIDGSAELAGAVNTILFANGRMKGFNTDVDGVVKSLEPFKQEIENRSALLLGAGGSARAVMTALVKNFRLSQLTIASRTRERADELTRRFRSQSENISLKTAPLTSSELSTAAQEATLIVNATPIGMTPRTNESPLPDNTPLHRDQIVMDLIYTPLQTKLLERATSKGAMTISGLEMFLHQGAKAFEMWTGKEMPMEEVREVLMRKLASVQ